MCYNSCQISRLACQGLEAKIQLLWFPKLFSVIIHTLSSLIKCLRHLMLHWIWHAWNRIATIWPVSIKFHFLFTNPGVRHCPATSNAMVNSWPQSAGVRWKRKRLKKLITWSPILMNLDKRYGWTDAWKDWIECCIAFMNVVIDLAQSFADSFTYILLNISMCSFQTALSYVVPARWQKPP